MNIYIYIYIYIYIVNSESAQFCYVAVWYYNWLKYFFLINLLSVPHNDKVKTEFRNVCKCIKKENKEKT